MSKFHFDKLSAKMKQGLPALLDQMANNAVNQFKVDNFEAQGFIDDGVKRWAGRKSPKDNKGRKILVKTGRGRNSIKVLSRNGMTRKIGTLVPYMAFHNSGTSRLPKRQFIGKSRRLDRKNTRLLDRYLAKYK